MAPRHTEPDHLHQPRLGCWWRLWIVISISWIALALAMATILGGWSNGVFAVLTSVFSLPLIMLLAGLAVAWVRAGRPK